MAYAHATLYLGRCREQVYVSLVAAKRNAQELTDDRIAIPDFYQCDARRAVWRTRGTNEMRPKQTIDVRSAVERKSPDETRLLLPHCDWPPVDGRPVGRQENGPRMADDGSQASPTSFPGSYLSRQSWPGPMEPVASSDLGMDWRVHSYSQMVSETWPKPRMSI